MPAPSRNEIAEKHRVQRRDNSPYSQRGRKEKMAASRGWRPTIWKALTFWRGANDEDLDSSEEVFEENGGEDAETEEQAVEDGIDADSSSVMNYSIVSEDQVFRQLVSPTPRQVRFQLPSPSHNSKRISHPQPGSSSPFITPRQQPYVAPLPPSSSLNKIDDDPLVKVSRYLDDVVRPRGGEFTEVEAIGLSMLIQSAVKGSNSATSTPSRDVSPNRKPLVLPAPNTPLKPTFTAPNTNFAAIFAKADSSSTSSTTTKPASSSRSLARNPNGTIMFQGGGSAKSRYRSSAFGTTSQRKKVVFSRDFGENKTGSSNGISNPTSSVSEGKRRRIEEVEEEEDSNSSAARSSGSGSGSLPQATTTSSSSFGFQTKESGNGNALLNGHGTAAGTSRSQPSTSAPIRFGVSSRYTATTPVRPSPLRQSMRADSSSPGSPSSNRSTPEARTNGNAARQGQAKAVAIMAEIIQSATQPKNDQLNADIANPYDTRPASKRARKATKPARPPPRPPRRVVSAEIPPPPELPRKPTALETIEQTAPTSVKAQSKRVHAEMIGLSQPPKPKRPSPVPANHVVIEIDDEEEEEPPAKRARPEKTKPAIEPIKESTEVIDVDDADADVDMDTPTSIANVIRPSEILEPMEAETSDSTKPAVSRTLYPASLSKAGNGFGVAPKKPSPLRNSFQPESDNSTTAPSKPKELEAATTTPSVFGPTFTSGFTTTPAFPLTSSNNESSKISSASSLTSTSTMSSLFGTGGSFSSSNTSFSSTFSNSKFGASSTEDKIFSTTTTIPNTNGFTPKPPTEFSSSDTTAPSQPATKSYQFGSSTPAFFGPTKVDSEEAIKKDVLAMDATALPVYLFTIPAVVVDDYLDERNAVLALPKESLPKFTFDTKAVPKSASAVKVQQAAPVLPPPKTEIKAFDYSAAGVKAPVSSGWTCSVCCVSNKVSDSKCVCCGEKKP